VSWRTAAVARLLMPLDTDEWRRAPVPPLLHQFAPSNRSTWKPVWLASQPSWTQHFRGFEYRLWADEDLDEFVAHRFPAFLPTYRSYASAINRVDAARYFVLYELGGIYADLDIECVRNFAHELPAGLVSIAESPFPTERFQNALMASPARHPFWRLVLEELFAFQYTANIVQATGPGAIDRSAARGPHFVHPLPRERYSASQDAPGVCAVHRSTHSWKSQQASLKHSFVLQALANARSRLHKLWVRI
jgi:hypothetical protein